MGWFSKQEAPKVIHTSERRKCWGARDAFFKCLDAHSIEDPTRQDKEARQACPTEIKEFESACVASWVEHFKLKRVQDILSRRRVQELEAAGYQPLDPSSVTVTEVTEIPDKK